MAVAVVDVRVDSSSAVRNLQQVGNAGKSAESALSGLTKSLGPLLAAFSAVQAAQFVFVKTAELETQTRSIQTLTGSAQQAKQIISAEVCAFHAFTVISAAESGNAFSSATGAAITPLMSAATMFCVSQSNK